MGPKASKAVSLLEEEVVPVQLSLHAEKGLCENRTRRQQALTPRTRGLTRNQAYLLLVLSTERCIQKQKYKDLHPKLT